MTAREVFEGMLIELSKVKAPSLLLEDFNYLFNKTIRQYTERQYDVYDTNQKTTDTLRVLKSTAVLNPKITEAYNEMGVKGSSHLHTIQPELSNLYGNTYEVELPNDYLHMLNCICVFKLKKSYKCYNKGSYVTFNANRLDSDKWGLVINDYYNRPLPTRPYYFIHNVNISSNDLTNQYDSELNKYGTDQLFIEDEDVAAFDSERTIDLLGNKSATIDLRANNFAGVRQANPSPIRMEIRCGKDNSVFELVKVSIDYLKAPQRIRLTPELMDLTEDKSQIMEFPDHICQLIINELVMLVMENSADPRLQTNMSVNQTTMPSISSALQQAATTA